MKGRMKRKEKNRFNVELLIENPPQIHMTNIFLISGIVDIRLVITVARQNICPQGSTQPRTAVAIESKKIVTVVGICYVKRVVINISFNVQVYADKEIRNFIYMDITYDSAIRYILDNMNDSIEGN